MSVSEAESSRHKLPHLVVLPQQNALHLGGNGVLRREGRASQTGGGAARSRGRSLAYFGCFDLVNTAERHTIVDEARGRGHEVALAYGYHGRAHR